MAIKDLLVSVNSSKHCGKRIDLAARLAQDFDAHLAGVFTIPEYYIPAYVAAQVPADVMAAHRELAEKERDTAKTDFETRMRKAGISWEWREAEGDAAERAVLHARYADMIVVGQNDPDEELSEAELDLPERVMLEAGRPVLMVPYAGSFSKVGERVMVAWSASAQSTRAVNDAMPFLARAKKVTILAINPPPGPEGLGDVPGGDIALHLARHGVKAEASHVYADDVDVGDMILSRSADEGVDLIVMGAYGHARVRELVLGGATRDILAHMTVPVLMSH
jgi:nucleotide-binding universal stress UspA family protein